MYIADLQIEFDSEWKVQQKRELFYFVCKIRTRKCYVTMASVQWINWAFAVDSKQNDHLEIDFTIKMAHFPCDLLPSPFSIIPNSLSTLDGTHRQDQCKRLGIPYFIIIELRNYTPLALFCLEKVLIIVLSAFLQSIKA